MNSTDCADQQHGCASAAAAGWRAQIRSSHAGIATQTRASAPGTPRPRNMKSISGRQSEAQDQLVAPGASLRVKDGPEHPAEHEVPRVQVRQLVGQVVGVDEAWAMRPPGARGAPSQRVARNRGAAQHLRMPGNEQQQDEMPPASGASTCVYQIGNFETRSVVIQLLTIRRSRRLRTGRKWRTRRGTDRTDHRASGRAKAKDRATGPCIAPPKQSCAKAIPTDSKQEVEAPMHRVTASAWLATIAVIPMAQGVAAVDLTRWGSAF
jgi:hypothetical protein